MAFMKEFDECLRIGLEEIKVATNNFSGENFIGSGGFGKVYKGELVLRQLEGSVKLVAIKRLDGTSYQDDREFLKEVMHISRYKHENILSLVGFCDEDGEHILVYEFQTRGSLDRYLSKPDLTWSMRLRICVGAARGLSYLHDPQGNLQNILHRDITSANILLDENWGAKITGFGLSKYGPVNEQYTYHAGNPIGVIGYVDPLYLRTGRLTKESDIYSFGVVLLEVLCGKPAVTDDDDHERRFIVPWAYRHHEIGRTRKIVDPILINQMHPNSLSFFSSIAFQCLNMDRENRPTMVEVAKRLLIVLTLQLELEKPKPEKPTLEHQQVSGLDHLKIPLKEIRTATNNFKNLIGGGGFGGVYQAELFHFDVRKYMKNESEDPSMMPHSLSRVAVKKLDRRYGQGKEQFLQEIKVLSHLYHHNLVLLLGFCDEDNEMILVYEHVPNGSLDRHIRNTQRVYSHTWAQRLQICIDVAHGLNYLHDHNIIHRDIKAANILLGRNWEGKIGDFGLSRISNHVDDDHFTLTNVVGTIAYVDPSYARTSKLTKRSDIYSFGVVLLEVLCGRLAVLPKFGDDPEFLLHMFKRHFEQKMTLQIVDPYLVKEFEKDSSIPENFLYSIYAFVEITYKCLYDNQAQNLTMRDVITELIRAQTFHVNAAVFSISDALQEAQTEEPPLRGMLVEDAGSSHDLTDLCPVTKPLEKLQQISKRVQPFISRTEMKTITILLSYQEDILMFQVAANSRIVTLKEEAAKRLKLDVGTFDLKYLDDDYEWIRLVCDAHLQECVDLSISSGSNIINLAVMLG